MNHEDIDIARVLQGLKSQKPEESKSSVWFNYVKEVQKELSDKQNKPITYNQAMVEASKRRRILKEKEDLDKKRRGKINTNRRNLVASKIEEPKKLSPEEIQNFKLQVKSLGEFLNPSEEEKPVDKPVDKPVENNIVHTYYFILPGQVVTEFSYYMYESYKEAVCCGILDFVNKYSKHLDYSLFDKEIQVKYYNERYQFFKLFVNNWFFKSINIIFDESYRHQIEDFRFIFLNKFSIEQLDFIRDFLKNFALKHKNKIPYLCVTKREILKKL